MSITALPNGRFRAQVYDPATGRNVSVAKVLDLPRGEATFRTKREAKMAREKARERLEQATPLVMTVRAFAEKWTSDPLYQRPKESTNIVNRERIKRFVQLYGHLPLEKVNDRIVADWIAGGKNLSTVGSLRAMFNDAGSAKAGRLIEHNPFTNLGLKKQTRRYEQPPTEGVVWAMIEAARKKVCPSYAAWLQVGCFSGLRPGELDALRWESIDFDGGRIHVREQFNAATKTFTLPKNGFVREAPLTPPAREALLGLPRVSEFCFVNFQGQHWQPSARSYHWRTVAASAGWEKTLYLATRHFSGWYMRNVLHLDSEDVAIALGHRDGGELVRTCYGHLDEKKALDRVAAAYESAHKDRTQADENGRIPLRVVA